MVAQKSGALLCILKITRGPIFAPLCIDPEMLRFNLAPVCISRFEHKLNRYEYDKQNHPAKCASAARALDVFDHFFIR